MLGCGAGVATYRTIVSDGIASGAIESPEEVVLSAVLAVIASFAFQFAYIVCHEKTVKAELKAGAFTHSFGLVYRNANGAAQYLLVRPKATVDQRVLPNGHIEPGEGHGEAAVREVAEEASVAARLIGYVGEVAFEAKGTCGGTPIPAFASSWPIRKYCKRKRR